MKRKRWKPFNLGVLDDGLEAAYELADMAMKKSKKPVSAISRSKYYSTTSDGTKVDLTYQSKHEVLMNCYGLILAYGNFYNDDRTTDLAPYTVNVSIHYKGVTYPLTFDNGNNTKRVELGSLVYTDPLPINMELGDTFHVRTHVVQNTGEKHPRGLLLFSSPNQEGASDGDTTGTAAAVTPTPGTLYGLTPLALFATPAANAKQKVVGFVGSSSSVGTGRSNTVWNGHPQGDLGYLQIGAFMAGWSHLNLGMNGQKASDFAQFAKRRSRVQLAKDCDLVIVQYASNDLSSASTTFEDLRADLLTIHKLFWDMGIPTAQTTVNPRTNSTDGWTTLQNQTPINANFAPGPDSTRGKYNRWTMKNTDGIKGIDCNPGWESAPESGLWRVSPKATDDGIHPNTFGHDNAAAEAVRDFLLRQD